MSGMLTGWAHRRWIGSIRMKEEQRMRAIGFAALAFAAAVATPAVGDFKGGHGTTPFTLKIMLEIWDRGDKNLHQAISMYLAGARDMLHWSNIDLQEDGNPMVTCAPDGERPPSSDDLVAMLRPYAKTLGSEEATLVLLYAFKMKYPCKSRGAIDEYFKGGGR